MNSIQISYSFSRTWSQEDVALAHADESTLRYRAFLGDVEFHVGNLDASAPWGWVPILDFALGLVTLTLRLNAGADEQLFEFTESDATIAFRRSNGTVEVDPTYTTGSAEVPLDELREASEVFLDSLLRDLSDHYPELRQNNFIASLTLVRD